MWPFKKKPKYCKDCEAAYNSFMEAYDEAYKRGVLIDPAPSALQCPKHGGYSEEEEVSTRQDRKWINKLPKDAG